MQRLDATGKFPIFVLLLLSFSGTLLVTPDKASAAAPTFRAATSSIRSGGPASIDCDKPTGTVQDDLLLAFVTTYDSDTNTVSAPGGWSTIRGPDRYTGTNKMASYAFYKVAGAGEGSSYTFTLSGAFYTDCAILTYTGVDTSDPVDAASSASSSIQTTRTGLSITTSSNDETLLLFSSGYGCSINLDSSGTPSGMTERILWDGGLAVYDETRATAGATSDRTHVQSCVDSWVTQMMAIKSPAAAGSSSGRIIHLTGYVRLHGNVRL